MTTKHSSAISRARISWDANGKPYSLDYGDIYFSEADAVEESRHVFLDGNDLAERFSRQGLTDFTIGECGFGAGLNFLNTCRLWCEKAPAKACLHYMAFEKHPVALDDLRAIHEQWPLLQECSAILIARYPPLAPGFHRLHLELFERKITLDLLFGDVIELLGELFQPHGFRVDAWYMDGFAPRTNPRMWSDELCRTLARLSRTGSTVASYSAAGTVRRALTAAGFTVERTAGYGQKRHMTRARFDVPDPVTSRSPGASWFTLPPVPVVSARTAAIIGAGLAGCATADAFARSGWQVTLIEREAAVATMASGNPRGIVHCRIARGQEAHARFSLQAYLFAIAHYERMARDNDFGWQQCGLLQFAHDEPEKQRQRDIIAAGLYDESIIRPCSPDQSTVLAGTDVALHALYFPDAGYLNPRALCDVYRRHPLLRTVLHTNALGLEPTRRGWRVQAAEGPVTEAEVVVIANSHDAGALGQAAHYPLTLNPGQVDSYEAGPDNRSIRTILCGAGYLLPADKRGRCLMGGAGDTSGNLKLLTGIAPDLAAEAERGLVLSRSATRCGTPDYLPLAGPVEALSPCREIYGELVRNAGARIERHPAYEPGLFINVGHGSHGISTTPLCADYLASLANGSPPPFTRDLINALHPIRYLIRNLKKQRL